jgi:hypothetical protein
LQNVAVAEDGTTELGMACKGADDPGPGAALAVEDDVATHFSAVQTELDPVTVCSMILVEALLFDQVLAYTTGCDCTYLQKAHFMARWWTKMGDDSKRHTCDQAWSGCPICDAESAGNALWLYPVKEADHNGAFAMNGNTCYRLEGWRRAACSTHVHRVADVHEAGATLEAFPDGSLISVVLGGHGNGRDLLWGPDPTTSLYPRFAKHKFEVNNDFSRAFLWRLAMKVRDGATIILDSCHAACEQASPNLVEWTAGVLGEELRGQGKVVRVCGASDSVCMISDVPTKPRHGEDAPEVTFYGEPSVWDFLKGRFRTFMTGRQLGSLHVNAGASVATGANQHKPHRTPSRRVRPRK